MIKDIVVKLSVGKTRDIPGEFAISAAALLDAHLSAVAFAHEPPNARLREIVLGGVTREMLGSMTVPVLMSH